LHEIMDSTVTTQKNLRLRWLERGLLLIAVLCLSTWAWSWLDASYTQYRENQILDEALAQGTAPTPVRPAASETDSLESFRQQSPPEQQPEGWETARRTEPLDQGDLVGRIEIPRLGVSAIVLEGVDKKTLRRGVGHIPETSLPEQPGNVGLAAHRDSFFRALKDIRKNDIISLKTPEGTFEYRVDSTEIVKPEDTHVLADTGLPKLTLVTCYPFYYVGSAPKRFIVHAERIEGGVSGG
jgi:sortase A